MLGHVCVCVWLTRTLLSQICWGNVCASVYCTYSTCVCVYRASLNGLRYREIGLSKVGDGPLLPQVGQAHAQAPVQARGLGARAVLPGLDLPHGGSPGVIYHRLQSGRHGLNTLLINSVFSA